MAATATLHAVRGNIMISCALPSPLPEQFTCAPLCEAFQDATTHAWCTKADGLPSRSPQAASAGQATPMPDQASLERLTWSGATASQLGNGATPPCSARLQGGAPGALPSAKSTAPTTAATSAAASAMLAAGQQLLAAAEGGMEALGLEAFLESGRVGAVRGSVGSTQWRLSLSV